MKAIELHEVTKDYGSVHALNGVNLEVEAGQVFGFLGPNGAGKTTAIRILFDLIRPTSGEARVLGWDCQRNGIEARTRLGYLPGELSLYDGLTGRQTLDLFASMRPGQAEASYLDMLLQRLDLDPTRRVGAYSKGNRQKLGLILAMMHQPELLVLDEPTSGLDPLVQEEVTRLLEEQAAAGHTIFFSSHVLSEVERMCHAVAIIRAGRIVAVEDIGRLKQRSIHNIEVTFAEDVPESLFQMQGVSVVRHDGDVVHLEVRANLDAVIKTIAHHPVVDLRTEQANLEQVFLAYYTDGAEAKEPQNAPV